MMIITTPGRNFAKEYAYIVSVVFSEFLGLETNLSAGDNPDLWRIDCQGHSLELPNLFFPERSPETFFDGNSFPDTAFHASNPEDGQPCAALFGIPEKGEAGLDILGTIFFLLTSFEDHLDLPRDRHDRLCAETSWLGRNGLLNRPVVDELLELLICLLRAAGINIPARHPGYAFQYTCDMDHPTIGYKADFRFWARGLTASLVKQRDWKRFCAFLLARRDIGQDPYYTFPWICGQLERLGLRGDFYATAGLDGAWRYDASYALHDPHFKHLFAVLAQAGHNAGFHAGYTTVDAPENFFRELRHVRAACPMPVRGGRQHYLRFRGASTWRLWAEAGLEYDSSLGFSAAPGFRCGTAREFPVYDLERRVRLPLTERPLIAMETTLLGHMGLSCAEAYDTFSRLGKTVKRYGGRMTLLWHNHTLMTAENRELFTRTLAALA